MEKYNDLKQVIWKMPLEEYIQFMREVHPSYPLKTTAITNNIVNYWKNVDKNLVKKVSQQTKYLQISEMFQNLNNTYEL